MDLIEKTVKKNYIYEGRILNLRCDDAVLPNGKPCKREVIEHPGGASVLCVKDGRIALVRQYRYAYGEELLEIPAGKLQFGEDPMFAAKRELEEETGLIAERLEHMLTLYPSPGYINEKIYVYEAISAKEGSQHLDEDEFLNVLYLLPEEIMDKILSGEIKDGKTIAAFLLYKNRHDISCKGIGAFTI